MYYRNANCAVVVYDVTQAVSVPVQLSGLRFVDHIFVVVVRQGQSLG